MSIVSVIWRIISGDIWRDIVPGGGTEVTYDQLITADPFTFIEADGKNFLVRS